jgi:glycosyltransferase involved in cell wall biosynthesis
MRIGSMSSNAPRKRDSPLAFGCKLALAKAMPASEPHVSIIIPTYNRGEFVADAVDSCYAGKVESSMLEVIVVDDGSTDDTASILNSLGDRVRHIPLERNCGRNRARNLGLSMATGRYVKFLDSDDVLVPASLGVEVAAADDSGADLVVSGWQSVDLASDRSSHSTVRFDAPSMEPVIDSVLAGRAVPTSAALYGRSLVGDQRWDEGLRKLDDWDWFIRAALRAAKIIRVDVISYSWRQHSAQGIRSETMLRNAREHHIILSKLEAALAAGGVLTSVRKKRLAQYFYKEMRVLSLHDRQGFDWGIRHIYELDPAFAPRDEERQWWMKFACRILGTRRALLIHSAAKKVLKPAATDLDVATK